MALTVAPDKASAAFRFVWRITREIGLWSDVAILAAEVLSAVAKGVSVAASEISDIVHRRERKSSSSRTATTTTTGEPEGGELS